MKISSFSRSNMGTQSAWKGFTSQTLYILYRLVTEQNDRYDYYPEHLEDLMIKDADDVAEVVQVKDLAHDLALSDLDSTSQSEGLFRRALSLNKSTKDKLIIRIVHFGPLGTELKGLSCGTEQYINSIKKKFSDKYGFNNTEISWILERIQFEKVNIKELMHTTLEQLSHYVPTMSSPQMVQDLLTYYVFMLSKTKYKTSKGEWQEKVMQIGSDMAAFDGYSREYGSSLVRLLDLKENVSLPILESEFRQGVSTRPEHIRAGLDLERLIWLEKINHLFVDSSVVVVKGVSGQGKSALCYRYLLKNYEEEQVFCIRRIKTQAQAENLIKAMVGLSKHMKHLILFIDVYPGEYEWAWLVREAQIRGLNLHILVSIREEDFNLTNADQSQAAFSILDLGLFEDEARWIFQTLTKDAPHQIFRSFEEAWQTFGSSGPFLEFVYLLNNNQTLRQRLEFQINRLITDTHSYSESWLSLLTLVSYAGQTGSSVLLNDVKTITSCKNIKAALNRMTEEYLIRSTEDARYLEALHPLRAKVIYSILKDEILYPEKELLLQSLNCTERQYPRLLLMHYFLNHSYEDILIKHIADITAKDWEAFAGTLNAMLWLDVRLFAVENKEVFEQLHIEKGRGGSVFMPIDITGILRPNEFIADRLITMFPNMAEYLEDIKKKYKSTRIKYRATDIWLLKTNLPQGLPQTDSEWADIGYSLFWMEQRGRKEFLPYPDEDIIKAMYNGSLESRIAAVKGVYYQGQSVIYTQCEAILRERLIKENKVIWIHDSEERIAFGFVPPFFKDVNNINKEKNLNHYWTMKMVNFLSSLYPDRQVVGAELVGIDLLSDLGVSVIDGSKNIPKENRPDTWTTQLNSWHLNTVDYSNRPDSWEEYILKVLNIRHIIVEALSEFIKLIDKLYDKGNIIGTKAPDKMSELHKILLSIDFLLPKSVVDPYGLHGEGSTLEKQFLPSLINLSIQPYEKFRNAINDFSSSICNFVQQCTEVIIARINRQSIETVSDWHLTEFNLYNAIKQCYLTQDEFKKLFLSYTDSNYDTFEKQEKQIFALLLNVWFNVLHTSVIGSGALSYTAKQTIRGYESKINKSFQMILDSDKWDMKVRDILDNDGINKRYLLCDCKIAEGQSIEWYYKGICVDLRNIWKAAKEYNSYRLYLETQWPEMIFVPQYLGLPILGAFCMPMYRILDIPEEQIDTLLIPTELPKELDITAKEGNEIYTQWRQAFIELTKLRMLLQQYQQILDVIKNESKEIVQSGLEEWSLDWSNEVSKSTVIISETASKVMERLACLDNEETIEIYNFMIDNFTRLGEKIKLVEELNPADEALECIQNIIVGMIFLSPHLMTEEEN